MTKLRSNNRMIGSVITAFAVLMATAIATGRFSHQAASAAPTTINPYHGTYQGGAWGLVTVAGRPPSSSHWGGDVACTVDSTGHITMTAPGPGTGTVSAATGALSLSGTISVKPGLLANVKFAGTAIPVKDSTGKVLALFANGTWTITGPTGLSGNGKWLVQRTLTTP